MGKEVKFMKERGQGTFTEFDERVESFKRTLETQQSVLTENRARNTAPNKGAGKHSFKPVPYQFRSAQA